MSRFILHLAGIFLASAIVACAAPSTPIALTPPQAASASASPTAPAPASASPTVPAPASASPTAPAPASPTVPAPASASPTAPAPAPASPTAPAPAPASPTAAPSPSAYFGISSNGEVAENAAIRALVLASGAQMVRTSVAWRQIEPTPGQYDWSSADRALQPLTANRLQPLVLIMNNASWSASTLCGPVADLDAYAQFLRQLAARYPDVTYWALYNEPDNAHGEASSTGGCFGGDDLDGNGKPDYADYAAQLAIAWRALHAANPRAQLVLGPLAFDNFDSATAPSGYPGGGQGGIFNAHFLDQLFSYMQAQPLPPGEKYLDLLGFNYYDIYGSYWEGRAAGKGVAAKANFLAALLRQYGFTAPLLVSETGADSLSLGDDAQSAFLVRTFARGLSVPLAHVVWWTFQDFADTAPPPVNTWKYGLLNQDAQPKPAYRAYQTVAGLLRGAQFVQALNISGGEGYLFQQNRAGLAVLWATSSAPVTVSFIGQTLNVTDMFGAARAIADGSTADLDPASGRIGVSIPENPVYVQTIR